MENGLSDVNMVKYPTAIKIIVWYRKMYDKVH